MKPYWTHADGMTSWYRVHVREKNYSVKVEESPFEEDVAITEIKPSLVASGWTIPIEYDSNPFSAMMRYQENGKDV